LRICRDRQSALAVLETFRFASDIVVGNLAAGKNFERGNAGCRANTSAAKLRQVLGLSEGN
jgi:hypothetical protein